MLRCIYDYCVTVIVIFIQNEVAGSASGRCTYGTVTGQTLGGVRSRPTTKEELRIVICLKERIYPVVKLPFYAIEAKLLKKQRMIYLIKLTSGCVKVRAGLVQLEAI